MLVTTDGPVVQLLSHLRVARSRRVAAVLVKLQAGRLKRQPQVVEEFAALKADIQANGLREPIWLYDGRIIDGRNRYNACWELDVEPRYREWDGDDEEQLLWFVVSLNEKRRHLTSSQKATVSLNIKTHLAEIAQRKQVVGKSADGRGGRPVLSYTSGYKEDTKNNLPQKIGEGSKHEREVDQQLAKQFGTNRQYVSDAEKIKENAPDLFVKVHNGDMRIPEARKAMFRIIRTPYRACGTCG